MIFVPEGFRKAMNYNAPMLEFFYQNFMNSTMGSNRGPLALKSTALSTDPTRQEILEPKI